MTHCRGSCYDFENALVTCISRRWYSLDSLELEVAISICQHWLAFNLFELVPWLNDEISLSRFFSGWSHTMIPTLISDSASIPWPVLIASAIPWITSWLKPLFNICSDFLSEISSPYSVQEFFMFAANLLFWLWFGFKETFGSSLIWLSQNRISLF